MANKDRVRHNARTPAKRSQEDKRRAKREQRRASNVGTKRKRRVHTTTR